MPHGFASRNGLTAAPLAASGYVGIKRVFEREYGGYLSTFGDGHHMPEDAYSHGGWQPERPLEPIGARMNVMYAVAVTLLDSAVLIEQFATNRINRNDIWNLIERTHTITRRRTTPCLSTSGSPPA